MSDSDILSIEPTREDGIQAAIANATLAAAEEGQPMTITVCLGLGACQPGDVYSCSFCEIITVSPRGIVARESRRH